MITVSDISLQISAPIILVVEDLFTRNYLKELWQDVYVGFVVAGSRAAVTPMLDLIRASGHNHAYGVVDRDFRASNSSEWTNRPPVRNFVLPRHEIENYLLDSAALANINLNNKHKSQQDIDTRLANTVKKMCWWMAVREVLTELGDKAVENFPAHPVWQSMNNEAEAIAFLHADKWITDVSSNLKQLTSSIVLKIRLRSAHVNYDNDANTDRWLHSFSGKELLTEICNFIFSNKPGMTVQKTDWAIEVAKWQKANGTVPADLTNLHNELFDIVTTP